MAELLPDLLRRHVSQAIQQELDASALVTHLPGAASAREYYRVERGGEAYVVMVMPKERGSEEVSAGEEPEELPFVNVQRHLLELGIRVPTIYSWDPDAGIMVLEDLGDNTLELALGPERSEERLERLYGAAIDLLAALRARADAKLAPACIATQRAFEPSLYRWEFDHYLEWGLRERDGVTLSEAEAARFAKHADRISERLGKLPRGFTHRDYQSRNLMVLPGDELVLIDFQDALQGPHVYDLVALLRDSYVELPMPFVEAMVRRYLGRLAEEGGERLEPSAVLEDFHLLTVQRKLKDAGRFVFLDRVKGNPSFLPYIEPSLAFVRKAFEQLPDDEDVAALAALLRPHVQELR